MNLHALLAARAEAGRPVRVGLIGAGKFGAMVLSQARRTTGIHVLGIADLDVERARTACRVTGWDEAAYAAPSLAAALSGGATHLSEDAAALIEADGLDIVIEATGDPRVGIRHALMAIAAGRHIVMVNVEADVVAGPLLARKAGEAGVVYSLAYGDQPALICEHVDWARTCGFEIVSAGKGTRYHPSFHQSTPETVWEHFYISAEQAAADGLNAKMFNSFHDGSKSGIEMTAVCNATGLTPQPDGLAFPTASCYELASICKPLGAGGRLSHKGTTEVVSSLDGGMNEIAHHLRMGTFVVIEADHAYVRECNRQYGFLPDETYEHFALYRPTHMIGLELGVTLASVALRGEATGAPTGWRSDVVATAKRDLVAGEVLDGEGGYTVWGKQLPAARSLEIGGLPLGLASEAALTRDVAAGELLVWGDVALDETDPALHARREMEAAFAAPNV